VSASPTSELLRLCMISVNLRVFCVLVRHGLVFGMLLATIAGVVPDAQGHGLLPDEPADAIASGVGKEGLPVDSPRTGPAGRATSPAFTLLVSAESRSTIRETTVVTSAPPHLEKGEVDSTLENQTVLASPCRGPQITRRGRAGSRGRKNAVNPRDGAAMIFVRRGRFLMGNDEGLPDEKPARRVVISKSFWLYETEVTNEQ